MNEPAPTPYERMMSLDPSWSVSPLLDTLSDLPRPNNPGEPFRQPPAPDRTFGSVIEELGSSEKDDFETRNAVIDETGQCTTEIAPGYVIGVNPASGQNPLTWHMPTIGISPLTAAPAPTVTFGPGQMAALRVETDGHGVVTIAEIVVLADPTPSTHYQPEDPQTIASDGELIFKLATLELDANAPSGYQVRAWHDGGPIIVWPNLWTGENLGSGAEVLKKRDRSADTYQFRTLIERGTHFDSAEDDVGVESQIRVEELADEVRVAGNGKVGTLRYTPAGGSPIEVLRWNDGLVDLSGDQDIPLPTAGGGGSLPPGQNDGDMLRWDAGASAWILLPAPAAAPDGKLNVLSHSGTTPQWRVLDTQQLAACIGGAPATITVLRL